MNNAKTYKMKVTRIKKGVYKVVDSKGTWIAREVFSTNSSKTHWCGWNCEDNQDTSCENSWAVAFPTFKSLKEYSQK